MTVALVISVVATLLAVTLAYLILWVDRWRWEALASVVPCVVWGGACGAAWGWVIVPTLRTSLTQITEQGPPGVVGAVASVAIMSVLIVAGVAVASRARVFAGPSDGVVHGFAAGAGFAAVLNISMAVSPMADRVGPFAAEVLVITGVWSAWLGLGIGRVKIEGRPGRRALVIVETLLGGVVSGVPLLGVFPAEALVLAKGRNVVSVLVPLSCFVGLAGLLVVAWVVERRIIGSVLAAEHSVGVVPERAVRVVPAFWLRVRRDWWRNQDERRAVNGLLVTLALRQYRLQQLSASKARIYGLEVGRLRQRAREIFSLVETRARAD